MSPRAQRGAIMTTALGAALGALAIQAFSSQLLIAIMPWALMLIAGYLPVAKNFGQKAEKARLSPVQFNASVAAGVGVYDGFFGPGTGTFFSLGYSKLRAMDLVRATAHAKLLNFTTNIVSLAVFILSDQIIWLLGLVMACGQMLGARLGAAMALKRGVDLFA